MLIISRRPCLNISGLQIPHNSATSIVAFVLYDYKCNIRFWYLYVVNALQTTQKCAICTSVSVSRVEWCGFRHLDCSIKSSPRKCGCILNLFLWNKPLNNRSFHVMPSRQLYLILCLNIDNNYPAYSVLYNLYILFWEIVKDHEFVKKWFKETEYFRGFVQTS